MSKRTLAPVPDQTTKTSRKRQQRDEAGDETAVLPSEANASNKRRRKEAKAEASLVSDRSANATQLAQTKDESMSDSTPSVGRSGNCSASLSATYRCRSTKTGPHCYKQQGF